MQCSVLGYVVEFRANLQRNCETSCSCDTPGERHQRRCRPPQNKRRGSSNKRRAVCAAPPECSNRRRRYYNSRLSRLREREREEERHHFSAWRANNGRKSLSRTNSRISVSRPPWWDESRPTAMARRAAIIRSRLRGIGFGSNKLDGWFP